MINVITEIDIDGNNEFRPFIWYKNCVAGIVISVKICQGTSKKQF